MTKVSFMRELNPMKQPTKTTYEQIHSPLLQFDP